MANTHKVELDGLFIFIVTLNGGVEMREPAAADQEKERHRHRRIDPSAIA